MKNERGLHDWRRHRLSLTAALVLALTGVVLYLVSPARALRTPRTPPPTPPVPEFEAPPPLAPTALYAGTQTVPVLMYHDVTEKPDVYFDVSTGAFRRHLQALKAAGAQAISLADLYDHLRSGKEIPERAIVLTFDDGYSGQLRAAYPILKKYRWPATFFVHTASIGVGAGKQHLTWEQLHALDKEGLVAIESHTVTHPDDLRKCADASLERELRESRQVLAAKLGRKIRFLAYPVGNADGRVARAAREAGYEMAVTMGPGWAESPADALFVPRLYPKYVPEIVARLKSGDLKTARLPKVIDLKPQELEAGATEDGQVRMKWVKGGRLSTVRVLGRRDVPTLVRAAGAAAGLNGTFFSDARVNSAGAGIVGPIASRFGPGFAPGLPGDRDRIAGRPLLLISPDKIAFLPFQPRLALDPDGIQRLLPGATDCFIAGAWLVHDGRALTREELTGFRLSNIFDFRPRAFLGVDHDGRPFLGASSTGNESDRLAQTLEQEGLEECVLLDSGFSTSLVSEGEVLVSGIRRKDMPARPVPHVLLLHPVDPETGKEVLAMAKPPPDFMGPPQPPSLDRLQRQLCGELPLPEMEETPAPHPRRRKHRRR